jgi:hypothetical protein
MRGVPLALGVAGVLAGTAALARRGSRAVVEAGPGIQAWAESGERILFVALFYDETVRMVEAFKRQAPGEALLERVRRRYSTVDTARYNAAVARIRKRGGTPVLVTPFPTAARRIYESSWPNTVWALKVPKDAVVWSTPRVSATLSGRGGITYALSQSYDSISLVDGSRLVDARRVPDPLLQDITARTDQLEHKLARQNPRYKDAWSDTDEPLARAALAASMDLRIPPWRIGRPFTDDPMDFSFGPAKKGDRVVLVDGQVVVLDGHREIPQEVAGRFWFGERHVFTTSGMKQWGRFGLLSPYNLTPNAILRVASSGERVPSTTIWQKNKDRLRALFDREIARLEGYVEERDEYGNLVVPNVCTYGEGCEDAAKVDIVRKIRDLKFDRRLVEHDIPPWRQSENLHRRIREMPLLTDRSR